MLQGIIPGAFGDRHTSMQVAGHNRPTDRNRKPEPATMHRRHNVGEFGRLHTMAHVGPKNTNTL